MPYRSAAQRGWAHTPAGMKALGGPEAVAEWDRASKGKKLPYHVAHGGVIQSALLSAKRYADGGDVDDVDTAPGVDTVPTSLNNITRPVANVATGMARGLADWIKTPRRLMDEETPQMPQSGNWSEEDEYRRQLGMAQKTQQETGFGAQTALNLYGTSAPFVPRGALGVAGGSLPTGQRPQIESLLRRLAARQTEEAAPAATEAAPTVPVMNINRRTPQDRILNSLSQLDPNEATAHGLITDRQRGNLDRILSGISNRDLVDFHNTLPEEQSERLLSWLPEERLTNLVPKILRGSTPETATRIGGAPNLEELLSSNHDIESLSGQHLSVLNDEMNSPTNRDLVARLQREYPGRWNHLNDYMDYKEGLSMQPSAEELGLVGGEPYGEDVPYQGIAQTGNNRFDEVFDQHLAQHFQNQNEFIKHYFNGMAAPTISKQALGNGLYFDGQILNKEGRAIGSITRDFNPAIGVAHHGFLRIYNQADRGSGAIPQMLRNQIDTYKKLGINSVDLNANIDVGSYAWAKYGWTPASSGSWLGLSNSLKSFVEARPNLVTGDARTGLMKILNSEDPKAIWNLVDSTALSNIVKDGKRLPIGKALLTGGFRSWYGRLNLNDPAAMDRFDRYTAEKLKKTANQ